MKRVVITFITVFLVFLIIFISGAKLGDKGEQKSWNEIYANTGKYIIYAFAGTILCTPRLLTILDNIFDKSDKKKQNRNQCKEKKKKALSK